MSDEKTFIVYCHTNKINGKRYIGATSQSVSKRWGRRGRKYASGKLKLAIEKYGWESFDHEILYEGLDREAARKIEAELIKEYGTDGEGGYNTTKGGEDCVGRVFTDASRKKMSDSAKNRADGHKKSEEYKREMSKRYKDEGRTVPTRPPVKLIDENGNVYDSVRQASEATGINYHTLWNQVKGRRTNRSGLRIYE